MANVRITESGFPGRHDVYTGGMYLGQIRFWEQANQWEIVEACRALHRIPLPPQAFHSTQAAAADALYRIVMREV